MKISNLGLIKVGSVLSFIVMIIVNALANIIPINGSTTGEIASRYPNLFTPASFTFSIWGVIYLFLMVYTIFQTGILSRLTITENRIIQNIGGLYILSCIANTAWIFLWHYELIFLSVVVMLVLLFTLINVYLKVNSDRTLKYKGKFIISAPFSIYLGWISVATIANITTWLVSVDWGGWGIPPQIWTSIVIILALIITLLIQRKYKDLIFSGAILWSLLGILVQQINTFNAQYTIIIFTVALGMVIILLGVISIVLRKK